MTHPTDYTVAEGLDGLQHTLVDLIDHARRGSLGDNQTQYVLYRLGQQQSLLRIDLNTAPMQLWFYDLDGRPASSGLVSALGKVFWEQLMTNKPAFEVWRDEVFRTQQFNDVSRAEARLAQAAFLSGQGEWVVATEMDHSLAHARAMLDKAAQQKLEASAQLESSNMSASPKKKAGGIKAIMSFGLFNRKDKTTLEQDTTHLVTKKIKGPGT